MKGSGLITGQLPIEVIDVAWFLHAPCVLHVGLVHGAVFRGGSLLAGGQIVSVAAEKIGDWQCATLLDETIAVVRDELAVNNRHIGHALALHEGHAERFAQRGQELLFRRLPQRS